MREPYATLLNQYRDHWLLAPYLQGELPDFAGIAANPRHVSLASSELLMLQVALTFWNGDSTAKIADLAILDDDHLRRVVRALEYTCGARR